MSAVCPVCGAEQSQSLLCHSCTTRLERELRGVAAIVGDLDITLSKQARIGTPGKSGLARERIPINVGAIDPRWVLDNVLTTWARDVSGAQVWAPALRIPASAAAARALLTMINEIRRHPAVIELVDEVTDAIHQARRAVDRPADRIYLGQCYVETPDPEGRMVTCLNELYGRPNAREVRCQVCLHEHPVAERRAWLLTRAADMIVSVKDAASYLGEVGGITVSQASIRGYVHRQKLAYRAPVDAKRFRLGDLLEVVMDESERKGGATRSATGNVVA